MNLVMKDMTILYCESLDLIIALHGHKIKSSGPQDVNTIF